jgi:hypothetical protein
MPVPKIIKEKFVESLGYWCNIIQIDDGSFAVENTKRGSDRAARDGIGNIVEYFDNEKNAIDFLETM